MGQIHRRVLHSIQTERVWRPGAPRAVEVEKDVDGDRHPRRIVLGSPSSTPPRMSDTEILAAKTRLPGPLTAFKGERPAAPDWFRDALANAPGRQWVEVQGAKIETLVWGPEGAPGVLLMHGNGAHADWWSFIAPFLAKDFRVAAISWSGMGGSQWRAAYSSRQYVDEAFAVAQAAGLFASKVKPVFIGHSFGGFPTMAAAALRGEALRSVVLMDTPLWTPELRAARKSPRDPCARVQAGEGLFESDRSLGAISAGARAALRACVHRRSHCARRAA